MTSLEHSPPYLGERRPDGDELIYLVSGEVTVRIEAPGGDQRRLLRAGDALIVPRGLWHRIEVARPASLLYLTPGPSEEHRPLSLLFNLRGCDLGVWRAFCRVVPACRGA